MVNNKLPLQKRMLFKLGIFFIAIAIVKLCVALVLRIYNRNEA